MKDHNYMFNVQYAKDRGCTQSDLDAMQKIYIYLDGLLTKPFEFAATHREVVDQIQACEYMLQMFWKFDADVRKHNRWFNVAGCLCPKLDNSDIMYAGKRIINMQCPFHGQRKIEE